MNPKKVIELNRGRVDEITYELVRLIHERDLVVKKITRAKKELDLPMLDSNREKQLVKKVRNMAKRQGVDPKLAEKITLLLISHSRGLL